MREIPSDQWGIERYIGIDTKKNLPINNFSKFYEQINTELKRDSAESINSCDQKKFRFKDVCLGANLDEFVSKKKATVFPGVQLFIYRKTSNHALFNRDGTLSSGPIKLIFCGIVSPKVLDWDQDNKFKSVKYVRDLPEQFNIVSCETQDTLFKYPVNVKYFFANEILMKILIRIDNYHYQVPEEIKSQVSIENLKKYYDQRFYDQKFNNEQIKKILDNQIDKVIWINEKSFEVFSIDMEEREISIDKIKPIRMLPIIRKAHEDFEANKNINKAKKDF